MSSASSRVLRVICAWTCVIATLQAAPRLPEWLETARRAPSVDSARPAAVMLLDEANYTFSADGSRRSLVRMVRRFDDPALFKTAVARAPYVSDHKTKPRLSAWLIRPDGSVKTYGRKDLVDTIAHEGALASDARIMKIDASADLQRGAIFAWESEQVEVSPFLQLHWMFQQEYPVVRSTVRVELPTGWEVRPWMFSHAEVPARRAGNIVEWTLENLPAIAPEPGGPGVAASAARMGIDVIPPKAAAVKGARPPASWRELSEHFAPVYRTRSAVTPVIAARSTELSAGATTTYERLQRLGRAVQEMKYAILAVDLDRAGGYTPRPAEETLASGFGDCKDKTALLCSLAEADGVKAYPVITYSQDRRRVRPEWPSASVFNHCIAAIAVDASVQGSAVIEHPELGRLLIFDPADKFTLLGGLSPPHQGANALLVAGSSGGLIRLPFESPEDNRVDRSIEAELRRDGAILGRLEERYAGASAARQRARRYTQGAAAYERALVARVSTALAGAVTQEIEVEELAGGEVKLRLGLGAPGYAKTMRDQLLIFKPVLIGRRVANRFAGKTRTQPIYLEPEALAETSRVYIPDGFEITEVPTTVDLREAWGEYRASTTREADHVVHRRELVIRATELPPDQIAQVTAFFQRIIEAEQTPVVLERRSPPKS